MDRLIIETVLVDVSEVSLLKNNNEENPDPTIMFGFKAVNADQVTHAFSALKQIAESDSIDIVICKTINSGIYDIEIKTDGLDEPVRIMNKAIAHETLAEIDDQTNQSIPITLGSDNSSKESWISVKSVIIKDCDLHT